MCNDDSSLDQFPPGECFPQAALQPFGVASEYMLAELTDEKYHLVSQHFFATIEAHLYNFLSS